MAENYGIVPKDLMMNSNISTTAKAVYAALSTFGKDCFPSADTMSAGLGIDKHTYFRVLKELEATGRVVIERRPFKANIYHLR